ncbi:MAG: FHA domain-containing protein [Candidatus Brocadiae bacterium]|nr:FHA domain-containing protein [Candidatus Brocadiia bacterium]
MARILLKGVTGIVKDETFPIQGGQDVLLGRSRSCEISLKSCRAYSAMEPEERDRDEGLLTVSRKHLRIRFLKDDGVELEDLSSNGTFLDGKRVEKIVISDLPKKTYELRLGRRETFTMEFSAT